MRTPETIKSPPSRVLVLEDNSDDQELLLVQLRKMNFHQHVKFVKDGKKALELLTKKNPEVLISDICVVFVDLKLPGMSGIEFLSRLRSAPSTMNLPVIVMSGSISPADQEQCQKLKVLKFIPKPVTFQEFSMAVASVFHLPRPSER